MAGEKYYFLQNTQNYSIDLQTMFSSFYQQDDLDCQYIGVLGNPTGSILTPYWYMNNTTHRLTQIRAEVKNYITEMTINVGNISFTAHPAYLSFCANFKFTNSITISDITSIEITYTVRGTSGPILFTYTKTFTDMRQFNLYTGDSTNKTVVLGSGSSLQTGLVSNYNGTQINESNYGNTVYVNDSLRSSMYQGQFKVKVNFKNGAYIVTTTGPESFLSCKGSLGNRTYRYAGKTFDGSGSGPWIGLSL